MDSISFKSRKELLFLFVLPPSNADDVWKAAGLFAEEAHPRPNWSGYMQAFSKGNHSPNSEISMLPIIDISPSDLTCRYSTLVFAIDQSKRLKVNTPSITFDQPLYIKAFEIAVEKSLDIVIHLGGFHTLMSYAGSVGTLMGGSGLEAALQIIYGEKSVQHMLHGKAIARATLGHFLVEAALTMKLQDMLCDTTIELQLSQPMI